MEGQLEIAAAEKAWAAALTAEDLIEVEKLWRVAVEVEKNGTVPSELARERLALFLCLNGDPKEAQQILLAMGFQYKLSNLALSPPLSPPGPSPPSDLVCVLDEALPKPMLAWISSAFAPDSRFWPKFNYTVDILAPSPYFSFVHPCRPSADGLSAEVQYMENVIAEVRRVATSVFPRIEEATAAEWWAHCRPHSSAHQLHFDSDDEGRGGVRNPIASCVLYLSDRGVGGPTLVTNQALKASHLATDGWAVFPRRNRLTIFDGTFLHGVVPGTGVPEMGTESGASGKRITLMIAFWKKIRHRVYPEGTFGASMDLNSFSNILPSPPKQTRKRARQHQPAITTHESEVHAVHVAPVYENITDPSTPLPKTLPPYDTIFQGF